MSTVCWSKRFKTSTIPVKISKGVGAGLFTPNDIEHRSDKTVNDINFNTYEAILDVDYMIEEIK